MERLDRAVCNSDWRLVFNDGVVQNLPRTYSDHSSLIVYTQGKLKLNTDGCARGDPDEGGFGGLIRDEVGTWLCSFFGKLETCYSLEAEMWSIYKGLTIVLKKGLAEVVIETDSTIAQEMITNGPPPNCPYRAIVEDARHLLQQCNCSIHHIVREANQCADKLANMGADQFEHLVVMEDPPPEVGSLIVADIVGTAYRRI